MEKYDLEFVAGIVEEEGLGYAIQSYLGANSIEDKELSKLWKQCQELMDEIELKLKPYFLE